MSSDGFIPVHGGYEALLSYQRAVVVYDGTVYFTRRWLPAYGDRTVDQMVQAARSGKQNIVEGSMASGTSKEMEIKLTNVARASLAELKEDYQDFIRTRGHTIWQPADRYAQHLKKLIYEESTAYATFRKGIENDDPAISANILLGLVNVTIFLLKKQIDSLEQAFLKDGGLRERMTRARLQSRSAQRGSGS
jgi:four helix bundle suffix protein